MAAALYHSYLLPWTQITNELDRLKKYLIIVIATTVILSLVIPFLPVPKKDASKVEKLPERYAKLLDDAQKPKPKPPPPKKIVKKKEKKIVKKKEKKKVKKKEKKKKPKPKKKLPPKKTQAQKTAEARKKAQSVGLLAFADDLMGDLRDAKITKLNKNKSLSKGGAQASQFKRSMMTSGQIVAGSGGIDTDNLSSGVGSSHLAGRKTTKVDSDIDKIAKAGRQTQKRKGGRPARSYEDVSLVMDRNKGAIYSIYNRYLRKDPTLEGKIVFELTIDPSGAVVKIVMISSELNSPKLERKLLIRIKSFNFGARDVGEVVVTFPIDFLPS